MSSDRSKPSKNTKLLYKKSNLTLGRSSIFSDASQRYARSAISRMKRHTRQNDYYTDKGKVKRDLSLETDFCFLRRYCKCKLMSIEASSKSKYSTYNGTEPETIEEFNDFSASGDKKSSDDKTDSFNVDITVLMMENLRKLLNVLIKKHLMDDKDMKDKFDKVLNSILSKLEDNEESSCTTYVLETDSKGKEIDNYRQSRTCSGFCQVCMKQEPVSATKWRQLHKKYSYHSTGQKRNQLRIISTLSVPRKMCEKKGVTVKESNHKYKCHYTKNVKIGDSNQRHSYYESKNIKITESNARHECLKKKSSNAKYQEKTVKVEKKFVSPKDSTIVSICTTASTRNCFVLTGNHNIKQSNIHMLKIFPRLFCKSSSDSKKDDATTKSKGKNKNHFDAMPSLMRTIYVDDPANITSTDANFAIQTKKEEFTMTDLKGVKSKRRSHNRTVTAFSTLSDKTLLKKKASKQNDCNKKEDLKINDEKLKTNEYSKDILTSEPILKDPDPLNSINTTTGQYRFPNNPKTNKNPKLKVEQRKLKQRKLKYRPLYRYVRNIHSKRYANSRYRKRYFKKSPEIEFKGHLRRIVKYFFEYSGGKGIKFDVNINVCPCAQDNAKEEMSKEEQTQKSDNPSVINLDSQGYPPILIYTENASERYPAIIPLLDGAASQAKYMFDSKNSALGETNSSPYNTNNADNYNVTCQDINELKTIVKNISLTTERLVQEYLKRNKDSLKKNASCTEIGDKSHSYIKVASGSYTVLEPNLNAFPSPTYTKFNIQKDPCNTPVKRASYTKITSKLQPPNQKLHYIQVEANTSPITQIGAVISPDTKKQLKIETQSKGIQISMTPAKSPTSGFSGLKIIKEPRRTDSRKKNIKKSASYTIIESESILRVTDMTVGDANMDSVEKPTLKSKSVGKSKSLVNLKIISEKPKVITFYCDECSKKYEYIYRCNTMRSDNKSKHPKKAGKAEKKADKLRQEIPKDSSDPLPKDNEFPGNNAVRIIENYYELSNGIFPEKKCNNENFKPCRFFLPIQPIHFKIALYVVIITVVALVIGGLTYFCVFHTPNTKIARSQYALRVPRNSIIQPTQNSFNSFKAKFERRLQTKSPGFRWFSSELGF